ncbi:glutamate 5-kinase [Sanguibacter keddieii DSM 10542]|uniref:Glutamate 5-kinase n=1 Tax=Sanguibacter keddieii (strain ATCC 51767 / DSM 10542 / NCFB 3025 / ST-74) TaxID=446469 RepID=D1BDM5_SANKS|nr:glutamate 5-kinase [Sanguibacter keddieii DSM 10542]
MSDSGTSISDRHDSDSTSSTPQRTPQAPGEGASERDSPILPVPKTPRSLMGTAGRVVVKIGSSSLTREDGTLDSDALTALVQVIAARHAAGYQVVLVTSGALAAGLGPLGLSARPGDLATAQAAASVGQGLLVARYTAAFAAHGIQVGQLLLTAEDTVRRGHYRNAQRSLERLLDLGVVPVVNENDAVATDEIRFGDNDRLAALVSHLVRADAMVLLTDVDGLYDGPPSREGSKRIPEVRSPADIEDVEVTGSGSSVGTGGMVTKLNSVLIATQSGIPVVLTQAVNVEGALRGDLVGTWFHATGRRTTRRRLWLAYASKTRGSLVLDDGAVHAVLGGTASLLPAGITGVVGEFEASDPVELVDREGRVVARGLSAFDSAEIPDLMGQTTGDLRDSLGEGYDRAVVHRDDLVLVRRRRRS